MLTENAVRWTRDWIDRNRGGLHSPTVTRNLELIVAAAEGHGESGEAKMRDLLYQIANWNAADYPQDAAFWQRRIAEVFADLGLPTVPTQSPDTGGLDFVIHGPPGWGLSPHFGNPLQHKDGEQ